jgi:hypothetical protein
MALYGEPLLLVLAGLTLSLLFLVITRPPETNQADFYTFWDAGHWFRQGLDVYTGGPLRVGAGSNLNPPASVLLVVPYTYLPLRVAFVAWVVTGLLCLAVGCRWIARTLGGPSALMLWCGLVISQASFAAFQLGQFTPVLFVLFTLAWVADREDRPWQAGVALGVLIAAKPFLGLFAVYALLFRRSLPLAAGIALGAAAFYGVGLLTMGVSAYWSWLAALGSVTWPAHLGNGSLLGVLTRTLSPTPPLMAFAPAVLRPDWVWPMWYASLAVVGVAVALTLWRTVDRDRAWLLVGTCSLLVSPLGWAYYAPLMAGPFVALWRSRSGMPRAWLAAGYLWFCVPYTVVNQPWGPFATLMVGGAYTWGFLTWLVAGLTARPEGRHA